MSLPLLCDEDFFAVGDVEPLQLLLQYLADRAALDAVLEGDVFLAHGRVLLVIDADGLAIDVVEALLARFVGVHLGCGGGEVIGRGSGELPGVVAGGGGSGGGHGAYA